MEDLLKALANFITEHWFLTFLILISNPLCFFKINSGNIESKKEELKK